MGPIQAGERSEIAFFDVETTVPKRPGQQFAILEFGSILVCPRKLVELRSFSTLVRPADLSLISSLSVRCNGITRDAVVSAPSFADIADTVYDILHGRIWAGHNILRFDCARIREAFADIGRPAPEPKGTLDSLALLTQKFGRRAGDMKMATLATYFELGKQTHRSLDDVRMNLEVLKYCATVLFLESNLTVVSSESSVSPRTRTTSCNHPKVSPKEGKISPSLSPTDQAAGEIHPILSLLSHCSEPEASNSISSTAAQPDLLDMSVLRNELTGNALQSDISLEEKAGPLSEKTFSPLSMGSEGCSGYAGYLQPDEVTVSDIKAAFVPFYHGSQRIKLFYGNDPLCLFCSRLKVRFGIRGKFVDQHGRPRLNFMVDVNPRLVKVLEACDDVAKKLSFDSGGSSEWKPVVIKKEGFVNYPTARIHIPTESNGEIAKYATEIYQRDSSGTIQKIVFSKIKAAELEPLFNPGTFLDVCFSLEPYDYQQSAGIRLVAKKLVIHT